MELSNIKETEEACKRVPSPIATPVESVRMNHSVKFDFVELQNKFKTICADYGQEIEPDVRSQAVEFTSKMLYEVAPKSRKLDRNVDRTWKFEFPNDNCTICPTLFVSTYRKTKFSDSFVSGKQLCCSVRQASLLAMDTFIKLGRIGYNINNSIILTPLAADTFPKVDIPKLASELKKPVVEVIGVINSSCQSGGQYLALSEAAPALVASKLATSNLEDRIAASIITKTTKQYEAHGKKVDPNDFEIYSKYAFPYFNIPSLIQIFEDIQLSTRRQRTSNIPSRPSTSGTSSRDQPRETTVAADEELAVYETTLDDNGLA